MTNPKIGIILSSTRDTRFADKPATWFFGHARQRTDLDFELLDLRDFPMPLFNEVASNAWVPSQNEVAIRWQQKLTEFDGFVIIAAEYNHGPTAVLKNALDYAYPEWNKKPVAFVGTAPSARPARSNNCASSRSSFRWCRSERPFTCRVEISSRCCSRKRPSRT
ncbi:NADPH-dependent FMN reductase [Deinococcus yavapaiensis]|uniref:NAD(P)H-dependent FMN reductase n=1 Tax=Deinococcus yavapaiensis KR-236 TaxID=694435 RepID=A0A318SDM2_9DEIO|nr:NAD(P)H-dependent oxidoreductase [Deinococcus yavapaiensis]PYE50498.1 NAD(P)H-dependent FMN reductase [Deinococcus yavapaiensis KR-236]